MNFEAEIKRWGKGLGLQISDAMAKIPGFSEGTRVRVEASKQGLVVTSMRDEKRQSALPFSEKELLANLTPERAHADERTDQLPEELL